MKAAGLLEKDVTRQVSDFLVYRGWRRFRNNVGGKYDAHGNYTPYGERGMPDMLFVNYHRIKKPWSMMLWIETKRSRGGRLSEYQLEWQEAERARGAIVLCVSDFREFEQWYNEKLGWIHSAAGPPNPGNLDLFAKPADTG